MKHASPYGLGATSLYVLHDGTEPVAVGGEFDDLGAAPANGIEAARASLGGRVGKLALHVGGDSNFVFVRSRGR